MRKIFIVMIIFVLFCFALPILFTKPFTTLSKRTNDQNEMANQEQEKPYDYSSYKEISLLHAKTGEIEKLPMDTYLYGVVSAEMPVDFDLEALKAQAIVARTYTIYTIENSKDKHENQAICDQASCCQAWITKQDRQNRWEENKREENWEKIVSAVDQTKGKVIVYEGKAIDAFFHSNSGGTTEVPANVWGGQGYPYLQSVQTSGEENYTQYQSEVTLSKQEFIEKIQKSHPDFSIDFQNDQAIQVLEYTDGNRVKTVQMGNRQFSGVEIRTLLGLRSANFEVTIQDEQIHFQVKGYGHGVGLSQTGADSLAKQGKNAEEIIHHFYQNVQIIDW